MVRGFTSVFVTGELSDLGKIGNVIKWQSTTGSGGLTGQVDEKL